MFSICFSCSLLGSSRRGSHVGAVRTIRDRLLCSIAWNPATEERGVKASVEHSCCCGQFMPEAGENLSKSHDCVLEMTQGGKALSILAKTPVSCLFLHSVRNKAHQWEKWNNWSSLSLEKNWQKPGAGDLSTFKCSWKPVALKKKDTGKDCLLNCYKWQAWRCRGLTRNAFGITKVISGRKGLLKGVFSVQVAISGQMTEHCLSKLYNKGIMKCEQ